MTETKSKTPGGGWGGEELSELPVNKAFVVQLTRDAVHYEGHGRRGEFVAPAQDRVATLYPSDMAQNFWGAIWAWLACFALTIAISVVAAPRGRPELHGLVYGLTPMPKHAREVWYKRPTMLARGVLGGTLVLNVLFW